MEIINLTEEEIVLPQGYSLGIACEVEIADFANTERNEIIENDVGHSINIVRNEREERKQFEH